VIVRVPPEIWDSPEYQNRTWGLAYHTLWAVRFHLGPSPEAFVPWDGAIDGAEAWADPGNPKVRPWWIGATRRRC
jgi:hypothetical protein